MSSNTAIPQLCRHPIPTVQKFSSSSLYPIKAMELISRANLHAFFLFLLVSAPAFSRASAIATAPETSEDGDEAQQSKEPSYLQRFLSQMQYSPRAAMDCNQFPKVCHAEDSPGRHCCTNRCVNLRHDNLNCGHCGIKCEYGEACCHGRCVNTNYDQKNCGGCHRKCKKGSPCQYGMCSYA
uniref:Protein csx2 n=1 Tax=Anthurium amnicola TaxID=1678845 RepID=A0A1D1Z2T1_9ARAE